MALPNNPKTASPTGVNEPTIVDIAVDGVNYNKKGLMYEMMDSQVTVLNGILDSVVGIGNSLGEMLEMIRQNIQDQKFLKDQQGEKKDAVDTSSSQKQKDKLFDFKGMDFGEGFGLLGLAILGAFALWATETDKWARVQILPAVLKGLTKVVLAPIRWLGTKVAAKPPAPPPRWHGTPAKPAMPTSRAWNTRWLEFTKKTKTAFLPISEWFKNSKWIEGVKN